MASENLPAHEKDIDERIQGFNKEFVPLLAKYELQLLVSLGVSPDGRIVGQPVVVSSRKDPNAPKEAAPATPLAEG